MSQFCHIHTDIQINRRTTCPQNFDIVPISLSQLKHTACTVGEARCPCPETLAKRFSVSVRVILNFASGVDSCKNWFSSATSTSCLSQTRMYILAYARNNGISWNKFEFNKNYTWYIIRLLFKALRFYYLIKVIVKSAPPSCWSPPSRREYPSSWPVVELSILNQPIFTGWHIR